MMMEKKKRNLTRIFPIPLAVLLLCAGIFFAFPSFYNAFSDLTEEHHEHLLDIARSADLNITHILDDCRSTLNYAVSINHDRLTDASGADMSAFLNGLENIPPMIEGYISDILIIQDEAVTTSIKQNDPTLFSFPFGIKQEPFLCEYGEKQYSLAIPVSEETVTYAALIDLDYFYQQAIGLSLNNEYWLVLYNIDNHLFLQNDRNETHLKLISPEDAETRHDGISILVESETAHQIITRQYYFVDNKYNTSSNDLMTVLPTSHNRNGCFAIGAAVSDVSLRELLSHFTLRMVLCCVLIFSGFFLLFILLLEGRRKGTRLQKDLEVSQQQMEKTMELAHHQRLEDIGTITSGVAHEFSNLLTPIMGYSILCMESLPEDSDELMDNLEEIYQASKRAKSLISRISAMTRKTTENDQQWTSPDNIIRQAGELARTSIPARVTMDFSLNCPEKCLYVNETQIVQLILNIILNGFHALEERGGMLTVTSAPADGQVVITIEDDGPGIDPKVLPHIFDPFFSTKVSGKGTGLGLAICRRIAELHHGSVSAENRTDRSGARFVVSLPFHTDAPLAVDDADK